MKKGNIVALFGLIAFILAFVSFNHSMTAKNGILFSLLGLVLIVVGLGGIVYGNELLRQEDIVK